MSENIWLWATVVALGAIAAVEAVLLWRQRRAARMLSVAVARFMRGDYAPLPEGAEGAFPALTAQINLLCARMRHQLDVLQQEKTAIRDFLYDVSHQLKTPLATLHLYADMDAASAADDDARQRSADFLSIVLRMEALVQALLKLARLEADVTQLRFAEGDLRDTAARAVESLRDRLDAKTLTVRVDAPEPVPARHDGQWLAEALYNVIKNAADHAPAGSEITVTLRGSQTVATVEVADRGFGIAPQDLPHIFERFYRSADSDPQGCGIGLALAAQVLRRHHGTIAAANREGGGARFTLTLPRHPVNVAASLESTPDRQPPVTEP